MSKPIRITQAMKKEIMEDVAKRLDSMVLSDGKATLDLNYYYPGKDKATVIFSRIAWEKQVRLVDEFSSEVGWHGLVRRDPDDATKFYIDDLITFPQEVTGATVTPTQGEYDRWNAMLPPEQRNTMRYHGHSRVERGTSPSGTDTTFQKDIIGRLNGDGFTPEERERMMEELGDSAFYIFMIWNKRREHYARIFDLYNNIEYGTSEVDIVHDGEDPLADFIADAKSKVKQKTYSTYAGNYVSNYGGYSGYGGYNGYSASKSTSTPASTTPAIPDKKEDKTINFPSGSRADMDDKSHQQFPSGYFDGQTTIYDD